MTLTHSPTFMDSAGLTIMLTILAFAALMLFSFLCVFLCITTNIRRALCATCIITSISTAISFSLVHALPF